MEWIGAAQLDLALDVDDLAVAQARGGGDARRLAEGEVAELEHRQAVDLADPLAVGVDQQVSAQDRLVHPLAQAVGAVDLRRRSPARRRRASTTSRAGLPRPVIGLAQQIGQAAHVGRQLLRVARPAARAVLDHPRHGGRGRTAQALAPRHASRSAGRRARSFSALRVDLVLEVGRDLEQLAEIRVVLRSSR